jgi:hypothetical protein
MQKLVRIRNATKQLQKEEQMGLCNHGNFIATDNEEKRQLGCVCILAE